MKSVIFVVISIYVSFLDQTTLAFTNSSVCGIDRSPVSTVYEGVAKVETYPWLGLLYYPLGNKRLITSVVLVTKQMVIAAASEIDKIPKSHFRALSRVVLGAKCGVENEIRVQEYTYHLEYIKDTLSALAIVQLDIHSTTFGLLRPICPPPGHLLEPQFFAMAMSEGCKKPRVKLHKMEYVDIEQCKSFYRKSGLNEESIWPTHTSCARAVSGGRCLWRGGAVLAVKQDNRWRMLGFSVYGPGCGAPARFLDYGMYQRWVRASTITIGTPAVTRFGDDHIVLRRSMTNMQRYGPCDPEETKQELYTDQVTILHDKGRHSVDYNLTLLASVEYSCIMFSAVPLYKADYKRLGISTPGYIMPDVSVPKKPSIRLRRWCATPTGMCHGFQHLEIRFYVHINFHDNVDFKVFAYGREAKIIAPNQNMKVVNKGESRPRVASSYSIYRSLLRHMNTSRNRWFYHIDYNGVVYLTND